MDGLGVMVQCDRSHRWDVNRLHWSYWISLVPVSPALGEGWGAGLQGCPFAVVGQNWASGISEGFRGLWSVG